MQELKQGINQLRVEKGEDAYNSQNCFELEPLALTMAELDRQFKNEQYARWARQRALTWTISQFNVRAFDGHLHKDLQKRMYLPRRRYPARNQDLPKSFLTFHESMTRQLMEEDGTVFKITPYQETLRNFINVSDHYLGRLTRPKLNAI